jgi:hypothetical protein
VTASQPGGIQVEDQLGRRIRKPVDLVRCVVSGAGVVTLAVAGVAASATTSGVETGLADASRRLPHALLVAAPPLALFALLVLPVAMAIQLLARRQFRRLAEAAGTGVLAAAVTAVASGLLTRPAAVLAERPAGGDRRVRGRARRGVAYLRAGPADHGGRGPRDRPGRQVRGGLGVAAAGARDIAGALAGAGLPVAVIRQVRRQEP